MSMSTCMSTFSWVRVQKNVLKYVQEYEYEYSNSRIDRASLARIQTFLGPLWSHMVPYGPTYIALTHEGNKLVHFNGSQCTNTHETCTVYWSQAIFHEYEYR